MSQAIADLFVVDTDSHLTERPDLFTSRLPSKWQDSAPRVLTDDEGAERWVIGDKWLGPVGATSIAGTGKIPTRWEDILPETYDPHKRAGWMDKHGIYAQVLYPNIVALEGHAVLALKDEALRIACVEASNDYAFDFAAEVPGRFVPMACLPFWDREASIKEMKRCAERGQFGVVWAATLSRLGLPGTTNPYWDPFYEVAQDLGVALNFHVGVGYTTEEIDIASQRGGKVNADPLAQATDQVRRTALSCMNNGRTVGGLMMSGLCDRFPSLNFVAVESGFGYFPWMVEALDWQWKISGFAKQFPQRLMPSEYFHRQIYTTFWFEDATLSQLEKYADNVLFETDFPHDTSMTPGLDSPSPSPADVIKSHIANYGEPVMRKVFWENAARLYHLRAPEFAAS